MVLVTAWTARATTVENPRCEYLKAPLGIDVRKPRLCWTMVSNQRGQKQTAYQVLVASSAKLLEGDIGDLWDSRKVESNQSIHIEYAGKPLKSRMQCHWKVRVWDKHGRISDWSQPAFWTMGLLDEDDWKARWIGLDREAPETLALMKSLLIRNAKWIWSPERDHPAKSAPADKRFFRRVFELPKDRIIRKSRLQIACDNEFTLWVNDRKVGSGDDFTTPALFTLEKFLKPGMNVLAVESRNAGNQPNPAGLIVGLNVDFNIGKPLQMVTDDQWRVSQTAPVGWKAAVYDDHDWQKAVILGDYGAAPWGDGGPMERAP